VTQIASARTEEEVLTILTEGVNKVLDTSASGVAIVEMHSRSLVGQCGAPPDAWPNIKKIRISLDDPSSVSAEAFRSKGPVAVSDAEKDQKAKKWVVRFYREKAVMAVPIMVRGEVYGCLVVSERESARVFTEEEKRIAALLAAKAGAVIENLPPAT